MKEQSTAAGTFYRNTGPAVLYKHTGRPFIKDG